MATKKTDKTKKILLVEDYASLAMILREIASFVAPSCEIEWVDNGQKAVEKIKKGSEYRAIIMNYLMPVMDGIQATKQIRALGCTAPIIGWSALPRREKAIDCLEAGMDSYLEKSGNLTPMIDLLKKIEKGTLKRGNH